MLPKNLQVWLEVLRRRLPLLVKYGVSISVVVFILLRADLKTFVVSLKETDVLLFGVALLVIAFNMLVRSYKWQLLMRAQGDHIPLLAAQNINYMSLFFNNFFLGSIGGDAFRFYRATRYSQSKSTAASSVIMERVTGLLTALVLVLVVGTGILFANPDLVTIKLLAVLLLFGVAISGAVVITLKVHWKLADWKLVRKFTRIEKLARELSFSAAEYDSHRKIIGATLALSLAYHLLNAFSVWLFALAANANVAFLPLLFITPLVALLIMIPVSINGIGIQEGSYIFYLEQIGVSGPAALLVAVLARVSLLIFSLLGGLLFLISGGGRNLAQSLVKGR